MKSIAVAAVVMVCLFSVANASEEPEIFSEIGRLFFTDSTGIVTFNETSILYGVLIAVPLIILALLVLPALGIDLNNIFGTERSDATPNLPYYSQFAERSLDSFSPILEMLQKAYEKYM
ncbi:unnamed protein product [Meganyctiphanes norvegica]|uniref:Uncharacterized protein n=1 Tax=Meganyctiphanes norvegica TaxID=48144 RepID=A0AAV2SKB0_MEGNR